MRQQFLSSDGAATFASPATPNREESGFHVPMSWSSGRVPVSECRNRNRQVSKVVLSPFSSGRTTPSKWDDAERWISSPVLEQQGSCSSKSLQLIQSERLAKSKSGPLGNQMSGNYSPMMYGISSMALDSPLLGTPSDNCGGRRSCPWQSEQELACTREWLKLLDEPPAAEIECQAAGEKLDGEEDEENENTHGISRRDMGTQMLRSRGNSVSSFSMPSPDQVSPVSSPPPPASNDPTEMDHLMKDVKVDEEDTYPIRPAMKHKPRSRANNSRSSYDSSNGTVTQPGLPISELEREESKISSWEKLQGAIAEADIRKLEMKLEKKRCRSMGKIMKKLKRAEAKAEKMRRSLYESNDGSIHRICRKTNEKMAGMCGRIGMRSIANCFAGW